jgi:phosphoglycolate phosphatase-like HAD superfamily hydrolase
MGQKVAAIDLDDTLIDTYPALMSWATSSGLIPVGFPPLVRGYNMLPPGICDAFHAASPGLDLTPLPGATTICADLVDDGWKLVVVTARRSAIAEQTADLIDHLFPGVFSQVVCTNDGSKADALRRIDASLLVDDNVWQARCAQDAGIPSILFGDTPWNHGVDHVWRAANWSQVASTIRDITYQARPLEYCGGP